MTTKPIVIIIQPSKDKSLEEYRNLAEETLYKYYQRSPTALKNIPLSEKEKGDIAYNNALAENLARNAPPSSTPNGKRVV